MPTGNHDARKPLLTVGQQIQHLKDKGVSFDLCPEDEAGRYLSEKCNFFKLASYRKLFSKREGGERDGEYVSLDFGQLRFLAEADQQLRRVLLGMTLDIEHFQKVALLGRMERLGEDGYSIVSDYMRSLSDANREYRLRELRMSGRSPFSAGIYGKYSDDLPAWAFFELTSFGTLIDFVRYCSSRWDDRRLRSAHYDLKGVKSVRNCAAHGSCISNSFSERGASKASVTSSVVRAVSGAGLSKATRSKWMGCTAMQQVATTLVVYAREVPPGGSRARSEAGLGELIGTVCGSGSPLPSNGPDSTAWAAFRFIGSLSESLGLLE
ncbi:MAG: Abi family protein [Atopobium sp.]|jgi:abortive infection bacteriophage resistance protein|nr:Abi family protein [Atopobium sp.]